MADEIYLRDLPPEVDQNYMANTDKIREQARQSLGAYLADPNYQYLLRHRDSLSPKQSKELCVGAVLGYVAGLRNHSGTARRGCGRRWNPLNLICLLWRQKKVMNLIWI